MGVFNGLSAVEAKVLKRRIGEYVAKWYVSHLFGADFVKFGLKAKRTIISRNNRTEIAQEFLEDYLDRWHKVAYADIRHLITEEDVAVYVDFSLNNAFHRIAKKCGYDSTGIDVPYEFERTYAVAAEYTSAATSAYLSASSRRVKDSARA